MFKGLYIDKSFLKQLSKVRVDKDINVYHGPAINQWDLQKQVESCTSLCESNSPVTVLMEFLRLRNIKLLELFPHVNSQSGDGEISPEDFRWALKVLY